MNSKEQRLLNAVYDHQDELDFNEIIEKVGLPRGQGYYYRDKWTQKGWFDGERLTEAAPPRTETVRSALEKQGLFDKLRHRS